MREHANTVRLTGHVRQDLSRSPFTKRETDSQVVCANLIYDLLIQERRRILNRLASDGTLVLAGILKEQFTAVRRAYEYAGMGLVGQRLAGEWQSGEFRFRHSAQIVQCEQSGTHE